MWTINVGGSSSVSDHTANPVLDVLDLIRLVASNVSFQAFQNFPVVHNSSQNLHFEAKVIKELPL